MSKKWSQCSRVAASDHNKAEYAVDSGRDHLEVGSQRDAECWGFCKESETLCRTSVRVVHVLQGC